MRGFFISERGKFHLDPKNRKKAQQNLYAFLDNLI